MKAIRYTRYGDPSVLEQVDNLPRPNMGKKDILVRVKACEVTKGDCELRSFHFPVKWFMPPLRLYFGLFKPRKPVQVLGGYIAGLVEAVGSDVSGFQPGDRVFGSTGMRLGGYGEFTCVAQSASLIRMPDNLSYSEASSVILGGLNALHFMTSAAIKPGQRVLINGAGGSIGIYALQIAKLQGAEVTAIDAAHKLDFLRGMGADHVLNYEQNPLDQPCEPWDVIFNMVAGIPMETFLSHLTQNGCYLTGNPTLRDMLKSRRINRKTQQRVVWSLAQESRGELEQLKTWLEGGDIKPVVDGCISPDDIQQAHQRVESEQRLGAIVLSFDSTD